MCQLRRLRRSDAGSCVTATGQLRLSIPDAVGEVPQSAASPDKELVTRWVFSFLKDRFVAGNPASVPACRRQLRRLHFPNSCVDHRLLDTSLVAVSNSIFFNGVLGTLDNLRLTVCDIY